ncbi:uncharacterized protein LOC124689776 [Lolium rigidum]|uniref:uncharacterized protein LOC124689776 n=1 Tax=Lolium rigidum TaxID=89674 RepID=UPI001F5DFC80|nr:uncharacterized protein LOC124689776 [Lolium rigidum]
MGAPVVQLENEGSCTISACTGCTEAQHRLAYERVHGWGSFPCRARVPPTHLKLECLKRKVWDPVDGAWTPQIFKVIMDIGGIPTTRSTKGVRLNIHGYTVYDVPRALTPEEAATLLYMRGPFVSVLWANAEYEDYDDTSNTVYRGFIPSGVTGSGSASGTSSEGLHAVISFDYTFVETELWIQIMDSHTEVGPYRMILYEAFVYFILPRVDKAIELPKQ